MNDSESLTQTIDPRTDRPIVSVNVCVARTPRYVVVYLPRSQSVVVVVVHHAFIHPYIIHMRLAEKVRCVACGACAGAKRKKGLERAVPIVAWIGSVHPLFVLE